MAELIEECKYAWNDEKKGLDITGPNGNSIFLPATGFTYGSPDVKEKDVEGNYWTRMPYLQGFARYLYFSAGAVNPLDLNYHSFGFSVRPCRESN